jgi:hypothetical protein
MRWIIVLIGTVILVGCGSLNPTSGCEDWDMPDMILTPPAGATLIQERCSSSFNPSYRATLTIPPADLEALQAATRITDWQDNIANGVVMFTEEVARTQRYHFGTYGDGIYAEEVLIDTTNPELYTVYYHITFVD